MAGPSPAMTGIGSRHSATRDRAAFTIPRMPPESPHPRKLAFGGFLALAAAMGNGRFVYTPILPFMVESLGLSQSQAGLIASANFAGYLVGALLAATPWLPKSGRFWLVAGLSASAATTIATAAFSTVAMLVVTRFLGGVASAFVLVFASSVVLERLAAAGEGRLASVHFAGVGAGIALSAILIAGLAGHAGGWRTQWAAAGTLALLVVPAVAILIPAQSSAPAGAARAAGLSLDGRLLALIAAYGLFGFGYVITATFLLAIVRGSPEIGYLEPVVWVVVGLSGISSVALWTALGRRIGTFAAYAAACLVEALGVAASVLAQNAVGVVIASLFLGGTFIGLTALGLIGARALTSGNQRRVLALMTGAFGTGQIVGPMLAGVLFDLTGSFTSPSLLAVAALLAAAALSAACGPVEELALVQGGRQSGMAGTKPACDLGQELAAGGDRKGPHFVCDLDERAGSADDSLPVVVLERHAVRPARAPAGAADRERIDGEALGKSFRTHRSERTPADIGSVARHVDDLAEAIVGISLDEARREIDRVRDRIEPEGAAPRGHELVGEDLCARKVAHHVPVDDQHLRLRSAPFHVGNRDGADGAVPDGVEDVLARQRVRPALALQPKLVLVDRTRAVRSEDEFEIDRLRPCRRTRGGEDEAEAHKQRPHETLPEKSGGFRVRERPIGSRALR